MRETRLTEGENTRRRNKSATFLTNFLPQKSTPVRVYAHHAFHLDTLSVTTSFEGVLRADNCPLWNESDRPNDCMNELTTAHETNYDPLLHLGLRTTKAFNLSRCSQARVHCTDWVDFEQSVALMGSPLHSPHTLESTSSLTIYRNVGDYVSLGRKRILSTQTIAVA